MTDTATGESRSPAPAVVVRGVPGIGIGEHAAAKVTAALRHAHGPVHGVRIAVTRLPDPAVPEPVQVSCHVDLDGRTVHVHACAATARTAVDRVVHRLVRRLDSSRRDRRERLAQAPTSAVTVEHHRTYGTPRCSLAEAIADLAALGEDAHLFTHESGVDFLIQRTPSGHTVTAAAAGVEPAAGVAVAVRAPRLTEREALARLTASGDAVLFYVDPDDGRGRVLRRRDDGGLDVITP